MAKLRYKVSRTFHSRDTALATARQIVENDLKNGLYKYQLEHEGKFDIEEAAHDIVDCVVVDDDGNELDTLHSWEW